MKISELKPGMGDVVLEAEVTSVEAPREVNRGGTPLRVANVTLRDDSGTITLVLWNNDIERVQEGMFVKIEKAYVNTWQNKAQLTLGKFGKLTALA